MPDGGQTSFTQAIGALFSTAWDKVSALMAAGAILLPVWRPTLEDVSETASLIAPILGCLSLAVQIGAKLWQLARSPPAKP